jgi:hypothetical protein
MDATIGPSTSSRSGSDRPGGTFVDVPITLHGIARRRLFASPEPDVSKFQQKPYAIPSDPNSRLHPPHPQTPTPHQVRTFRPRTGRFRHAAKTRFPPIRGKSVQSEALFSHAPLSGVRGRKRLCSHDLRRFSAPFFDMTEGCEMLYWTPPSPTSADPSSFGARPFSGESERPNSGVADPSATTLAWTDGGVGGRTITTP